MAQNITGAPYKRVGGGVGGGLRLLFRHNETSCCAKGAINGLQTTIQGKAGLLIKVMDDRVGAASHQCNLIKAHQALLQCFRVLQCHEKAVWKSRPGYLLLFYCGVWIVHECSYKVSQ